MTCRICNAGDHDHEQHYEVAFTSPITGEPYPVPADIRTAAERICRAYSHGMRGICDPMWVANVIARELGRGDGEHHFTERTTA